VKDLENEEGTCYVTIYDMYQTSFRLAYKPEGAEAAAATEAKPAEEKAADSK
jgi:hypothetical protein